MNYLAHAYLSFNHSQILLGNMISDFVKGKKQYDYPPAIHKGIVLHRYIDEFTDAHPATHQAKQVFKADYKLYSGAFVDVAYDYFLANDEHEFSAESLFEFSQKTYAQLSLQQTQMPDIFKRMFFYMQSQNWLYSYRSHKGIHQSFGGLVKRAKYLYDAAPAIKCFEQHFELLQNCYRLFWKEAKPAVFNKFEKLF